jgi:hypothetical protein
MLHHNRSEHWRHGRCRQQWNYVTVYACNENNVLDMYSRSTPTSPALQRSSSCTNYFSQSDGTFRNTVIVLEYRLLQEFSSEGTALWL